jgi:hypothetical protein
LSVVLFITAFVIGTNGVYADTLQLLITDGLNSITIGDNGSGDGDSTLGKIGWSGNVGEWDLQVGETGIGSPIFGLGSLDLNFNANSTTGTTTTLTIMFTQTDILTSYHGWNLKADGTIEGGIGEVTYSAWFDNGNLAFAQAQQIGSTLSYTSSAFAGNICTLVSAIPPYSLTQVLTFAGTGGKALSTGDASLMTHMPEPTTIWLLGSGLMGVALLVRRKRF